MSSLAQLPGTVRRPSLDPAQLGIGIVHFGPGAFHRAHQAVFTEDAIANAGGDWGIVAVALRHPGTPDALSAQDGLYTLELLHDPLEYRVIGSLRGALAAAREPHHVLGALTAPGVHVVTLTITEKGYCLDPTGKFDPEHVDIKHDVGSAAWPRSATGWLVRGLDARRTLGLSGLSILSCDNLAANGTRLRAAVIALAAIQSDALARWIETECRFPCTMVDAITPATDAAATARVTAALGLSDHASVQREPFAQWVIEDNFAGPRPAWETAGVEIVTDVTGHQKRKLHVLNMANSTLAYFGLLSGHQFAHEAAADPAIASFLDALILEEVAPALPNLGVPAYWSVVRPRLANPLVRHALRQIGEDGSIKLAQRVFGLLVDNVRAGRPAARLAALIHAWLTCAGRGLVVDPQSSRLRDCYSAGRDTNTAFDDSSLFPATMRNDAAVRQTLLSVETKRHVPGGLPS